MLASDPTCPECGEQYDETQSAKDFPINRALLLMTDDEVEEQTTNEETLNLKELEQQTCEIHFKKLEAFSVEDKAVLCIDCILSDKYRGKQIKKLDVAAESELKEAVVNRDRIAENSKQLRRAFERTDKFLKDIEDAEKQNLNSI